MHSLNNNGDSLAQEFARILGANLEPKISKKASMEEVSEADVQESMASDVELEDDIADMLIETSDEGVSMASDSIDDDVAELDAYDNLSDKHAKIMDGLSKIASSLRSKNEGFAADVVEATALSIVDDFRKEAQSKAAVCSELSKIASELDRSGDDLSADIVRVTLERVRNN
ncbi:hypothetical protein EBR25_12715 [bacterium]|nr:hypothetical protein [bacterium]